MSGERSATPRAQDDDLRTAYQQVCTSYHAIDDFRAKLLGFLPLVSGAGIFLLLNDAISDPLKRNAAKQFLLPIGIFGAVVTLGLFAYEIYGIKRCHALILTGTRIERLLHVRGQFVKRPTEVAGFINEPFAAGIIYPAVLAAWAYLGLVFTLACPAVLASISALIFLAGLGGLLTYNRKLRNDANRQLGLKRAS